MRQAFFLLLAAFVLGCTAEVPEQVQLASSNQVSSKNAAARELVRDIRANFGSDAILTISSSSPRSRDFSPQVKTFARRAGVLYTDTAPDLVVIYELERTDGFLTGPGIENFVISANLVRPVSVNEGAEILYFSSLRGRCRTDDGLGDAACSELQPQLAEALLYSLRRP